MTFLWIILFPSLLFTFAVTDLMLLNFRLVNIFLSLPCSLLLSTLAPAPQQWGAVFQGYQNRQAKTAWCQQRKRMPIFPVGFFKPFFWALHTSVVQLSSCLPQGLNTRMSMVPNSSECWGEINIQASRQCFSCCACSGDFCRGGLRCQTNFWAQLKSCTPLSKADIRSLTERVRLWREDLNEIRGSFWYMLRGGACCCCFISALPPPRHVLAALACCMPGVPVELHSTLSWQAWVGWLRWDKQDPVTIYFKQELLLAFQLKSASSESLPGNLGNEKARLAQARVL